MLVITTIKTEYYFVSSIFFSSHFQYKDMCVNKGCQQWTTGLKTGCGTICVSIIFFAFSNSNLFAYNNLPTCCLPYLL